MLSNPQPATSNRPFVANALRKAGLMDRDEKMRDASDKPVRKGVIPKPIHKTRSSHRPRALDSVLGKDSSSSRNPMTIKAYHLHSLPPPAIVVAFPPIESSHHPKLAARIAANVNEGLNIRGASKGTATVARLRRNAISTGGSSSRLATVSTKAIDLWREFVQKRYNAEAKFLNLERMVDDEYIVRNRMTPPGTPGSSSKEAAVIFKLARELKPEVQTLSLAHNGLVQGHILSTLAHYLPKLANLSLEGNQLRVFKDLDYISARKGKLENLRELVLTGNPVRELEFKNGRGDKFRSELSRKFPSLEMLDGQPLTTIAFDAPQQSTSTSSVSKGAAPTSFPYEMAGSFITGVDGNLISSFLMRFFPLFDNQRSALLDVYHPEATFSFSANTSIPVRAKIQGHHHSMPNQRKLNWDSWISGSRNLIRMGGGVDRLTKTFHLGAEEAVKAMIGLPSTKHDVTGAPEKFCVDAWPVMQGDITHLFIAVHGEFVEMPAEGIRSFDRSFILAPAADGSKAKLAGWDVVILSDQLVVRAYSSPEAWSPGPMRVQAGESSPAPISTWISSLNPVSQTQLQQDIASIPEPQRTQILRICQRTGLNVRFAGECLQGNDWDFDRAVANFEQVKGTLARDAFL